MGHEDQPARPKNITALVDYFLGGAKKQAWKIGVELEHTLVRSNGAAVGYKDKDGQEKILEALSSKSDCEMRTEDGSLIGLVLPNGTITLEPAAQLELSCGPFEDLAKAKAYFDDFEKTLASVLKGTDIEVLTPGYHPTQRALDLELIPKKRYQIMNDYLGAISSWGIYMMRGSAATQVAIDYTSEEDCIRKLRLANACVPALSLICDNSPAFEGATRPHPLMRTEIWEKCDKDRCGTVPNVMNPNFTLADYAEYILDTPACVNIVGNEEKMDSRTFGQIYAETPMQEKDVEHALSMFFTDVRLKRYIEIRPADAMPVECVIAYAALIRGLFCNSDSLDALDSLFTGVTEENIADAKRSLMQDGYAGWIYGHAAASIVDELISIAAEGLDASDRELLAPLANLVANRETLADIALEDIEA